MFYECVFTTSIVVLNACNGIFGLTLFVDLG